MSSNNKLIRAGDLFETVCKDTSIRGSAFAAIRRHIDAAPAAMQWIPVTERLPEENNGVLTYRESGINVEFRWSRGWDNDEFTPCPVTHWMPLPEPPKGD